MRHSILNGIVYSIFNRFLIDFGCPGASKIIQIYYENSIFWLLGNFNIRSLLNTILVPTWPHFGSKKSIESGLGRVLARLGGLLGRLEGALESSWAVLDRLQFVTEVSWGRLGSVLGNKGQLGLVQSRTPQKGSAGSGHILAMHLPLGLELLYLSICLHFIYLYLSAYGNVRTRP